MALCVTLDLYAQTELPVELTKIEYEAEYINVYINHCCTMDALYI